MGTTAKKHAFDTVAGAWAALRSIKPGEPVDQEVLEWLSAAIERCDKNDPKQLVRELGLLVRGRTLTVSPNSVAALVQRFMDAGNSVMVACALAGEQMGCTTSTAHRWHKATLGAGTDRRYKEAA